MPSNPLPVLASQAAGKHSAKVTHLTDRIGWIVGLALVVALVYWLMRQGWQWRRTLQGGLPELPQAPDRTGPPLLELHGRYHGSTTAGQWLDRIVVHGLGVRSKVRLALTEDGLEVDRTGAPGFFVPTAALRGARLDKAIAGKVLTEGGLLVVTWEHGGTLVDSGFRAEHAADHGVWAERITALSGDRAVAFSDSRPAGPRDGGRSDSTQQHDKEGAR
ncbi:hypothetical protein [Actinacidiphila sp. ITFR-21]|uniref:PH-like domain-containing protein n=1 Tax=Actinacidiphila sp. ITFR-21 TaxID=3075199 RepID=UPI00288922F5|nr:hypothetical protein [Streptomyces sp. ITFR-21]WNI14638.1 hypothetical protein RLT57_03150 [Streptomyces sp. ITFR-21]